MKITIPGELTDLNTYIKVERTNRFAASALKKKETQRVADCVEDFEMITEYPVYITYHWYSPNARKDIDNVAFAKKFINDGLILGGVLENDSRKFIAGFSGEEFYIDKDNPRVEVSISTHADMQKHKSAI